MSPRLLRKPSGFEGFVRVRKCAEMNDLAASRASVALPLLAWMIARQTLTLVLVGIAVGLPIAWMLARLASRQMSAMLFELTPADPVTMTAATGLLILVAMGAGWLPARRAARIDPIVALRNE